MNILKQQPLLDLLTKNWTSFVDKNNLILLVLKQVRQHKFEEVKCTSPKPNTITIKLTFLAITETSLSCWVDFQVPTDDNISIGTLEFDLQLNGSIIFKQILGTTYVLNNCD